MEKLQKNAPSGVECSFIPTENDLELINRYTVKALEADEVFCFNLTLCDNEIDRDFERFSVEALTALAPMFEGKTGIADHSMKTQNQHSRIFKTWIEESEVRKTSTGENYTALKARAYIPITPKSEELIEQIKSGIKKETSISCAVSSHLCSVCSAENRKGGCKHRKGEIYDGKMCHTVLNKPTDAYEFSFVAVPAQPEAGVTKSFTVPEGIELDRIEKVATGCDAITLSIEAFSQLTRKIHSLQELSKDAERYRKALETKVARLGAMAVPELSSDELEKICSRLPTDSLTELEKAFSANAAKRFPLTPQLGTFTKETKTDNKEFKI